MNVARSFTRMQQLPQIWLLPLNDCSTVLIRERDIPKYACDVLDNMPESTHDHLKRTPIVHGASAPADAAEDPV